MKINKRTIKKIILIVIAVVLLFSIYLNTFLIIKYNVLPVKYLIIYFLIVALIPFLLIYATIFTRIRPLLKTIYAMIEVIYLIVLFVIFSYINQTFNFLEEFTGGFEYETKNYYILTLEDSDINELKSLKNKTIGFSGSLDESVNHALENLDRKIELSHKEYDGFTIMFEDLYNEKLDSILIIQGYYDLLTENDETIEEKTNIIYSFPIKEKVNNIVKDVDVTKETFNVYISGIDSYGDVSDQTRSDVNIVMSINPVTNKILMINIPRDFYVELDGLGAKDKLTHAGMYGVETSSKTIENLLDIEINYYVKVNYNAVIDLVDALGGVNVYSKYAFTTHQYRYKIKEGYNYVDGKKALDFVRTRKAFLYGDRVRGENQQAMIEAVIKKASSASILLKYDKILKSLEGSFTTNLSTKKIMELINMQLNLMPSWDMESISLNGRDAMGYCPTFPAYPELYVMIPNEETINNAKEALKNMQ